jgi:hypothetical protein
MQSKEERIQKLVSDILKYEPRLHKFAAQKIAEAWIEDPDKMNKLMKEEQKLEKQGIKKERRPFLPVYEDALVSSSE